MAVASSRSLSLDNFILGDKIGEGTYGKVEKAIWKQYKARVAVKILSLEADWFPLLSEVNLVLDLRHESIVNYSG
jgi:serine/threonine protein kinase